MAKLGEWLSVDKTEGQGNDTLSFSAGRYQGRTRRQMSVYVKAKYAVVKNSVNVTLTPVVPFITVKQGTALNVTNNDGTLNADGSVSTHTIEGVSNAAALYFEILNADGTAYTGDMVNYTENISEVTSRYIANGTEYENGVVSSDMASLGMYGIYTWNFSIPIKKYTADAASKAGSTTRSCLLRIYIMSDNNIKTRYNDLLVTQTSEEASISITPSTLSISQSSPSAVANVTANCSWEVQTTV